MLASALAPLAHGTPSPSELWLSWNTNPLIWAGLVVAALWYRNGWESRNDRRRGSRLRRASFMLGLFTLGVALLSPLDALSSALASAHMVQHLLLTLVAAPLLALGAPVPTLMSGLAPDLRRAAHPWRRRMRAHGPSGRARRVAALAGLSVLVMWFWHAAGPYDTAVRDPWLHALEHATFLITAFLSWQAILRFRSPRGIDLGAGVLVVFALSVQSAVLGALLTFAPDPWYDAYATTTTQWGLTRLSDQQLAGVIMWVPASGIYLVAALFMLSVWINAPPVSFPRRVIAPNRGGRAPGGRVEIGDSVADEPRR